MKKFLVSIIIVNYNGREILKRLLDSLKKQAFKNYELIVVDNASTDGSVEFIRENYKPAEWTFEGRGLKGRIFVDPKNIIELVYDDPSGGKLYCKNSCVASAEIKIGGQTLTSNNTTAFETVST